MLLSRHIFFRNGYFYYRIVIPKDLRHIIPFREIKQSLKTSNRSLAECHALSLEGKVQKAFTLLRSAIPHVDAMKLLEEISPRSRSVSSSQIKFSRLIDLYIRNEERGWTGKTLMEVQGVCRLLLAILGDKYVSMFTRQTMLDLRDKLERLPANIFKKYPDKTISEVLAISDLEPMSLVSVNKHLVRIGSILRFGVREGFLVRNVAEGLIIPIKKSNDEERSAYSDDEILKVIGLLTNPSGVFEKEKKWIPLVGIYSGMRLDEICQLYLEDIQQVGGIWCFNVNDEKDKKLKNLSSRRIVPIHPFLIEHGFLEFVKAMRTAGSERLWPSLTFSKINGYSNLFGKWFQRFNRQHISQDKRKVFHSFRHSFANKLKQEGVSESIIAELMGHKNHSITMGRYGKRYEPQKLLEGLAGLKY